MFTAADKGINSGGSINPVQRRGPESSTRGIRYGGDGRKFMRRILPVKVSKEADGLPVKAKITIGQLKRVQEESR